MFPTSLDIGCCRGRFPKNCTKVSSRSVKNGQLGLMYGITFFYKRDVFLEPTEICNSMKRRLSLA